MNLAHINAVVFDLDGTLVDSKLDFTAICDDIGWPQGTPLLEQLAMLGDTKDAARAAAIIRQHELAGAAAASWMPGAEACLHHLREQGYPLAILTRNMREATQQMLQRLRIPISLVLTREDCAAKPDPEGLHLIAEHIAVPCQNILYVGDYLFDLQVASNAGAMSCLYLNETNQRFITQADYVIQHFAELTAVLPKFSPIMS